MTSRGEMMTRYIPQRVRTRSRHQMAIGGLIVRLLNGVLVISAVVVLVYALSAVIRGSSDQQFMATFDSAISATFFGVLVAIPFTLWMERKRERQDEHKRQQEMRRREDKILALVKSELEVNRQKLEEEYTNKLRLPEPLFPLQSLKNDLWRALSESGDLRYVDDLDLIDALSQAYYDIRTMVFLSDHAFNAVHFGRITPDPMSPEKKIARHLVRAQPDVSETIERAISAIERRQSELTPLSTG